MLLNPQTQDQITATMLHNGTELQQQEAALYCFGRQWEPAIFPWDQYPVGALAGSKGGIRWQRQEDGRWMSSFGELAEEPEGCKEVMYLSGAALPKGAEAMEKAGFADVEPDYPESKAW